MAKQRHEAIGEIFQEVGVLVFVFVPLDIIFRHERFNRMDIVITLIAVVLSVLCWEIGIRLECETP